MNSTNVNIAVAGCGSWGRNLVRNFADLGALRFVCDLDSARFQSLGPEAAGLRHSADFASVLSDSSVDGVVIATPAGTHYELAKATLEAGKDVFVEKPMALHSQEGIELVRIAERKGRILMVGHLLNYHPAIVKLKQLIGNGTLGNIYTMHSTRLNFGRIRQEENVLLSFASHDISVLINLTGEMPKSVSAWGRGYLQNNVEDEAIAVLDFTGGVQGHIFVSWLYPQKEQRLAVVGDCGMAVFDDLQAEDKLVLYDHAVEWDGTKPFSVRGAQQIIEVDEVEPLRLECQHFLDCIQHRRTPNTDGANGVEVLQVLEACQLSLEQRKIPGNGQVSSLIGRAY